MLKASVLAILALVSAPALAARLIGFEADAFNRAYPVSYAHDMVFSPVSFEIDCALVAESLPTIPKANVSETLGVVIDLESAYRPIIEGLSVRTNGFSFTSVRGFCVPEMRFVAVDHRINLSRIYGAEVLSPKPRQGAESWFRASMDGEMEDFTLPEDRSASRRYSFYDLVSLKAAWRDPFPVENTHQIPFHLADGTNVAQVAAMSDTRVADIWETREYTVLKLPLKGDSSFYALLPQEGYDLQPARADFSTLEIHRLLSFTSCVTEKGVYHGPIRLVIPRLEIRSRLDFSSILTYFKIPTKGLIHLDGTAAAREYVQHARFRLCEGLEDSFCHGGDPAAVPGPADTVCHGGDPAAVPAAKSLVLDHPFLFFVYHESTQTILVAGQFAGNP